MKAGESVQGQATPTRKLVGDYLRSWVLAAHVEERIAAGTRLDAPLP